MAGTELRGKSPEGRVEFLNSACDRSEVEGIQVTVREGSFKRGEGETETAP